MTSLTKCPVCGRPLFETIWEDGKSKFKIFTSYGHVTNGAEDQFYCYECYENRNKKIFKEDSNVSE